MRPHQRLTVEKWWDGLSPSQQLKAVRNMVAKLVSNRDVDVLDIHDAETIAAQQNVPWMEYGAPTWSHSGEVIHK